MADFSSIAQTFVDHYFTSFDDFDRRSSLASLYRPESTLTWESSALQGVQDIIGHLTKSELKVTRHTISTVDSQPGTANGVVVLVTGTLAVDNDFDKPMIFTQSFTLAPIPGQPGAFSVQNQIFRLISG
ncbi:nuclear transport factor 2 family protein [Streptomyces anulatus]|uniref:Nuclear transport factor 2 family protein n=1 Tax=Streptomyces anulatus TaxID=1892 RepID=A0ABZ1ZY86_STRAQ|nr:nuclear transport factor 2 family protein [Streptomyces anulatus]